MTKYVSKNSLIGKGKNMWINKITLVMCALIIGIGIFGSGYNIGKGLYLIKKMNRSVTVKGLAEKNVSSDLAIWEINFREVGSNLIELDQRIQQDQQRVVNFLQQQGFTTQEIDKSQFKVEDRLANIYSQPNPQMTTGQRYVVTAGMRVRSMKVGLIKQTVQAIDKLLQQGVPLAFDIGLLSPNPSYYYTQLDRIRPIMLAEATKSAYLIAQQFATDTESKLGKIQRANQGVFQIMGRDTSTLSTNWNSNQNALGSIQKKVRLVTTIEYQLK